MNWSWRFVGDPISEEELETLHQKQASYGIQSVQLKVNQVQNSPTLDSEATKEFYENIDKYIDQKLSEKDSQNDLVKENEADKDWGQWTESVFTPCFFLYLPLSYL